MNSESEKHVRAREGLAVCLLDVGNGQSRVIMDDVVAGSDAMSWRYQAHYTWNAYENESLDNMALSDEQYRDIGIALVARLLAINGRVA